MKKIIITLASVAVLAASVHAVSKNEHPSADTEGIRQRIGSIVGELRNLRSQIALTEDQRSRMKGVIASHKSEIATQLEKGRDARRAMRDAVETHGPDSAEAAKAADGIAQAARSRALLVAKIATEAKPILTEEQRGKMKAARERIENSVDEMVSKFGE